MPIFCGHAMTPFRFENPCNAPPLHVASSLAAVKKPTSPVGAHDEPPIPPMAPSKDLPPIRRITVPWPGLSRKNRFSFLRAEGPPGRTVTRHLRIPLRDVVILSFVQIGSVRRESVLRRITKSKRKYPVVSFSRRLPEASEGEGRWEVVGEGDLPGFSSRPRPHATWRRQPRRPLRTTGGY
jgi:hypothetical protein